LGYGHFNRKLYVDFGLNWGAGHSGKKVSEPALKREVVNYVTGHHGYSQRRACRLTRQHRSVQRYQSILDRRWELRQRMKELAAVRVRYGYRRIRILLNREG
jgi:putative transposase